MNTKSFTNFIGSKAFLYLAGAGAVYLILKRFGLLPEHKTAADKEKDKARTTIALNKNIWTTWYWQQNKQKQLTDAIATDFAKRIKNSFGVFNDDEAQIFGVFRAIRFRTNVSQISDFYTKLFKRDMLSDLKSYFDEDEMNEVYDIILTKPE